MPGMGRGLSASNPTVVSAFHAALLHQTLVVLLLAGLVAVAWNFQRAAQLRQARTGEPGKTSTTTAVPTATRRAVLGREPTARKLLRVSFGLIWVFDGILQGQASMPLGMVPQVVGPTAAASPLWAQHLVDAGTTVWSYHPVTAATAAVWVQVGAGMWLLAAPRGNWSRLGGLVSVAWGLVVWVFGETFGGIFAPGLSWVFGAPGAAVFYCLAGALVALPEAAWATPRLGRALLRAMGLFFLGMALLQAWPGRGFWQGQVRPSATPGALTSMAQQMSQTPQPEPVSALVADFGRLDAAHGWAVNLFVVVALAALGTAFVSGRARALRPAVVVCTVFCLADWLVVQDFGFFGGEGTDPNSMVPMLLVIAAGYLAVCSAPAAQGAALAAPALAAPSRVVAVPTAKTPGPERASLMADPAYTFRCVAALAALGVTLLGAAPLSADVFSPHADPLLAQAVDGAPQQVSAVAPPFSLVDQFGKHVSSASLRGKVVALTFLDDTCTTDCPVIAQELREADGYLGADARQVEMVAVNANPRFTTTNYLRAFTRQEGLQHLPNWLYLTGTLPELRLVWKEYGEAVLYLPGGAMIGHSEYAWAIDRTGYTRDILDTDPGPATSATQSSFAALLAQTLRSLLKHS